MEYTAEIYSLSPQFYTAYPTTQYPEIPVKTASVRSGLHQIGTDSKWRLS